jgi:hypothetical protein
MKAELYMQEKEDPVALFDEVKVVELNDNHQIAPYRVFYRSQRLNATKVMLELYRYEKMLLKMEDGRQCSVLLQHSSMDVKNGDAVGVLRVLGDIKEA